MPRTEIYLPQSQLNILREIAHQETTRTGKGVSIAELIRGAVDFWLRRERAEYLDATNFILQHPDFRDEILQAKEELGEVRLLTREEALGK